MHNTRNKILGRREAHRLAGRGAVVFTNGCFDILHPGHVDYLQRARALGSCLVVGLNSDASVRRLKGPSRPVNDEASRAMVLSALACVDYVVVFEEDTPYELIRDVAPDVLVKGGDWSVERIVGRDLVEASGGRVLSIPLLAGHSTTAVIERILAANPRSCNAEQSEK
jgi:rfaE bifunctional protein nucleotidyltransferase chain/domain